MAKRKIDELFTPDEEAQLLERLERRMGQAVLPPDYKERLLMAGYIHSNPNDMDRLYPLLAARKARRIRENNQRLDPRFKSFWGSTLRR